MLVFKQLFTCCLLVALSYTSASDSEPAFNNVRLASYRAAAFLQDNIRAEVSPITGDETLDICIGDLVETKCCARAKLKGLHTLATGEEVYCSDGWAIFQRRMDGSILDFQDKSWEEYAEGFGHLSGEFWLGLRKIHQNTKQGGCRLRVDLEAFDYDTAYAEYSQFFVADEADLFRISVGGYSGTAGDSMMYHNGMAFSTNERDNDLSPDNCATYWYAGGWWNNDCFQAAPNGIYGKIRPSFATCWYTWKEEDAMKFIQMGVRCD